MGFQTCYTHGLRYPDYGECAQCTTERLAEESMRRQEELLREQVQLMRERADEEPQRNAASQNQPGAGTITTANLSKDLLKSILDDAVMENSYDADGDLVVREQGGCFVLLSENKDRIRLLTAYVFKPDVPHSARLEAANNINSKYVLVRASVDGDGVLYLDHDMLLNDGITKRSFTMTVKHFCVIPHIAVQEHAANLVQ